MILANATNIGHDLSGNTFWEFRNRLNSSRPRRIAQYPSSTHYGDVNLDPAWLQWLRHTRAEPPSNAEQQYDVQRQQHLKVLAARADQRWREQESYLKAPTGQEAPGGELGQPKPFMSPSKDGAGVDGPTVAKERESSEQGCGENRNPEEQQQGKRDEREMSRRHAEGEAPRKDQENPWKLHNRGPSEGWQPETWTPGRIEQR